MDSSSIAVYIRSSHLVKARLTWFERLQKGQRADCEAQRTMQTADKLE